MRRWLVTRAREVVDDTSEASDDDTPPVSTGRVRSS
jgi:hypothetical protein